MALAGAHRIKRVVVIGRQFAIAPVEVQVDKTTRGLWSCIAQVVCNVVDIHFDPTIMPACVGTAAT
jgi:hypothetical protein